jgi:hypothetical protein
VGCQGLVEWLAFRGRRLETEDRAGCRIHENDPFATINGQDAGAQLFDDEMKNA